MARTRISTTVDAARLELARAAFGLPDSQLVDRALEALLRESESQRERMALLAMPYESDDELAWSSPDAPALPYDGTVPPAVERLAAERRATYRPEG